MRKVTKFLSRRLRMIIVGLLIVIQVVFLSVVIYNFSSSYVYINFLFLLLSYLMGLVIMAKDILPEFKLSWMILFFVVPLFGGLFYLIFGTKLFSKKFIATIEDAENSTKHVLDFRRDIEEELRQKDEHIYKQSVYLKKYAYAPLYKNTQTTYLSPGEEKFEALKNELRKAEHYIFLEYFIVEQGVMWDEILDILIAKVREGVDVRMLYDDVGSLNTLPPNYNLELEKLGIQCKVFNPFKASMSIIVNHRDHRKIVVIDGHTAFTGGINLADEYINQKERFGHWKDSSIMIKGEAVWSFTVMFLQFWDPNELKANTHERLKPTYYEHALSESDGFVQPYSDSPVDDEPVGERVYLNLINNAKKNIYIYSPYFIVDQVLIEALCLASKNGVDVYLILPHIPDKKTAFVLTRSDYKILIKAGVKVYEYTPGFLHSKAVICDGEVGAIGTVNFDYRSFYHHFECGIWMYQSLALKQLQQDIDKTLSESQLMTMDFVKSEPLHIRAIRAVIKVFAPLM